MKIKQEVYGLHKGEGCEDFDAGEMKDDGSYSTEDTMSVDKGEGSGMDSGLKHMLGMK